MSDLNEKILSEEVKTVRGKPKGKLWPAHEKEHWLSEPQEEGQTYTTMRKVNPACSFCKRNAAKLRWLEKKNKKNESIIGVT